MPRPVVDKALMRRRFVVAAEEVLRSNGGMQLALADVAAYLGMSQSNSYRYFPDRQALISMLAENWFTGVEVEVAAAVATQSNPEQQVLAWVLTTMRAKCARYDADPLLFSAYLTLAKGESKAIAKHVDQLREMIRPAIVALVGRAEPDSALMVLEDATILYRNPYLIAQHRPDLSEDRASLVTRSIVQAFGSHRSAAAQAIMEN